MSPSSILEKVARLFHRSSELTAEAFKVANIIYNRAKINTDNYQENLSKHSQAGFF